MELYDFQRDGRDFLSLKRRAILADEMGLGKTVQALSACRPGRTLIVCPKAAKGVWAREIGIWCPGKTSSLVEGKPKERSQQIAKGDFTIINNEQLLSHYEDLKAQPWQTVIVDEAHRFKERKNRTYKNLKLLLSKHKDVNLYLLTGTPIMNRGSDLWGLLHLIDPQKFRSYWDWIYSNFQTHREQFGQWNVVKVDRPLNFETLRKSVSEYMLRRTKEEVLDLPPVTYEVFPVKLPVEQRKAYLQMASMMYAEIREGFEVTATTAVAKIVRLKQIAISPDLLDPEATGIPGAKLDALLEILEDAKEQEIPVVLFSCFAQVIKRLATLLHSKGYRCAGFTGSNRSAQFRTNEEDRFQAGDADIFLTTIGAGSESITLTRSSLAIFMDLDWTPARNAQAVSRIHRNGQQNPCHVIYLRAQNTIETWIARKLQEKEFLAEMILPEAELVAAVKSGEDME